MITATDNLRRRLEERRVEWKEEGPNRTKWRHDGIEYLALNAFPINGGAKTRLILNANITPAQAIAVTLGRECELVLTDCDDGLMPPFTAHCGKCGAEWGFTPKFCPECGAKVTGTRDERKKVK